ncbi:MAG: hypothetical protein LAP13_26695 [Acidobacteriia bacterium]|nr:hypothetical protein [Terriglobia bacterium]
MTRHSLDSRLLRVLILQLFIAAPLIAAAGPPTSLALGLPAGITVTRQGASVGQQIPLPTEQPPIRQNEPLPGLKEKQKRELMKANYEKMKRDADELASLAKSLQEDVDKSNENVLSLHIVEKAEKIEKLAKRIKSVAKGY